MKLSLGLTPRDYSVAGGAVVYDTDAQAYFTANTAITSSADKNAINNFYLGLKSDGIYTKIKAMYLPIWGSAATSKWNLVNPLDTNGAFRLTFATGMTFTSSGMAGNGTTGYADTNFNPSISSTLNNTHYSFYSRTNNDTTSIDMGYANISGTQWILSLRYTGVGTISDQYNGTTGRVSTSQTNSQGFFIGSRTTSAIHKAFKNGSQIGTTNTGASGSFLSLNVALLGQNRSGTVTNYSTKQCSFASIGDGLTDTESTNFYSRVQTLMTYFGINV